MADSDGISAPEGLAPDGAFELTFRVRYAETDAMGYVHHANYAVWFEMGRTEMLRASGGNYREMEEQGLFLVVAKLEVRFHQPARYDDEITLRTRIAKATGAKLVHSYEVVRAGQTITTGETTLACVDRDGTIRRLPELRQLGIIPE